MTDRIAIPEKNIDLEDLGLINQDLFPVSGALAERYLSVLKEAFGLECKVDSFRIDKRGVSPELSACLKELYPEELAYGENYLNMKAANRFMVVVSPDQKNAPLVAPQTSFENDLFDLIYKEGKQIIEDITQRQAMFGEMENRISLYETADDLLHLRKIEVSLDTLGDARAKIAELKDLSERLGDGDNALDADYISDMQALVAEVGDVRVRTNTDVFPVCQEIRSFYVEFFQGVHCFRDFARYGQYTGAGAKTLFVTHHQEVAQLDSEIRVMDLHDDGLLNTLELNNLILFDDDLIDIRIEEIENEALLADGIDVVSLSPPRRKKQIVQHAKAFPPEWHELRDLQKILENSNKSFDHLIMEKSISTRIKLAVAHADKTVVNHLLAELDPTDPVRLFESNRQKLIKEFPDMPDNRKRYIASRLLEAMKGRK